MKNFGDWLSENPSKKPWLVIGKGPTFEKVRSVSLENYRTISLNHTIVEVESDIFHMIDLDVLYDIEPDIGRNAKYILMPYYPNIENKSGNQSLDDLLKTNSFLREMDSEGRLLWYNSSQSKKAHLNYPIIPVKYFSADAVVALLVTSGVTEIWSAGIDGGNSYNNNFSHLNRKTLLSNNQDSFDYQFIAIASVLEKYKACFIPLNEKPIRIFVGAEKNQWLAMKVLEFSIKRRTSASIELMPLYDAKIAIPKPKDIKNFPRTPFSFQRFLIPELCNFEGKAIYLDSDMQVFSDIRELANKDMKGRDLLNVWDVVGGVREPQFSVMLINCKSARWKINRIVELLNSGELSYEELMHRVKIDGTTHGELAGEWNSLEYFENGTTKLIHYTDMEKQPWLSLKNLNGSIWMEELMAALKYGYLSKNDIKEQILIGNIRPTVLYQLKTRKVDAHMIPALITKLDKLFKAPHKQKGIFWKSSLSTKLRGYLALSIIKIIC